MVGHGRSSSARSGPDRAALQRLGGAAAAEAVVALLGGGGLAGPCRCGYRSVGIWHSAAAGISCSSCDADFAEMVKVYLQKNPRRLTPSTRISKSGGLFLRI